MPLTLNPMHMSNNKSFEPQRTNQFEVIIPFDSANDSVVISLAVSEFSLPNITNDPIEIGHVNHKVKFAGQANFTGSESLMVNDFITNDVELIIYKWHLKVFNPETGSIGWAADYKKTCTVIEFAPDGTTIRTWKLEGVWPSGVSYGDSLTYDGSDVKKINLTLSYDRAYRVI